MDSRSTYIPAETLPLDQREGELLERYTGQEGLAWLGRLNSLLDDDGSDLLYRQRNRVYRLDDPLVAGESICVKVFKQPDRLRSAWYRRTGSKAARAHAYARHLYQHGAAVAEPIGYLERWEGSRLVESLLLSRYLADATDLYSETTYLLRERPYAGDYIRLLRVCAEAIRTMHDSGFLHGDLGPQNILLTRTGPASWANPTFIDLNRGRLKPEPTMKERARDMERMKLPSHFLQIFRHLYWKDGPIPAEFERQAERYRARFRRHQRSRQWRHPVRSLRQWLQPAAEQRKEVSTGQPPERDLWLWDEKSGQPSVTLKSPERRRQRRGADIWPTLASGLRHAPALLRHYRAARRRAYHQPVTMAGRLGVCLEVDDDLEKQLEQLSQTPGLPVFVRLYHHLGAAHLERAEAAITRLADAGHEVSIGLVQSRRSVTDPDGWQTFMADALARLHRRVHCVEIGHAVNRVKWGLWNLAEMTSLWQGVTELKARYPGPIFLGPAINDFEFHYYPPLLDASGDAVDALSCHLYVDRRGAPENGQYGLTTLEKCLAGRAIADTWGKAGFYITEVNWPLTNTGLHSPLAGAYQPAGKAESDLHVSEATSAAYLVRYALMALCSGAAERLWWWRLAHPGFGLIDNADGWRERPGWQALAHFHRSIGPSTFRGREERDGALWWHFDGLTLVYATEPTTLPCPAGVRRVTDLSGEPLDHQPGQPLAVSGAPLYLSYREPT